MIASILALALMQVGPNPSIDAFPGTPEELRDRKPREKPVITAALPEDRQNQFADCLATARDDADSALDIANAWRVSANNDLDLVRSAHCLGLALVTLERFDEARQVFEAASAEAPESFGAYRARLLAMAGNAAMSGGKVMIPDNSQPGVSAIAGAATRVPSTAPTTKARIGPPYFTAVHPVVA